MIKYTNKEKIIEFLRNEDEIANLNMIGAIENITGHKDGKPLLEIYVDNLEHPNGVIVKEYDYWHYIYHRNTEFLRNAKENYFDALESYGVDASDEAVYNYLKKDRMLEWEEFCTLLYLDEMKVYEPKVPIYDGCIEYANMINDHYTYKDEESLYFIKDNLINRPSSIIKVNDEPVGWILMHRDGSVGIMYIKEEHRLKGYAYELSMSLLKKVVDLGNIPFIHININNQASFKLAEKCGFKKYKQVFWFGIKN